MTRMGIRTITQVNGLPPTPVNIVRNRAQRCEAAHTFRKKQISDKLRQLLAAAGFTGVQVDADLFLREQRHEAQG